MKKLFITMLAIACLSFTTLSFAQSLTLTSDNDIKSVLAQNTGKIVTIRLQSGQDMTGKLLLVTDNLVHLGELSRQEFYDGVIDINNISAILIKFR